MNSYQKNQKKQPSCLLKTLVGYDSKNPGEMFDEEAVSNYLTNFNRDVPTPSWSMHGAKSVDGSRFEYDRDGQDWGYNPFKEM